MNLNQFFTNKVIVITGAKGGLGQALIKALLPLDAKVIAMDIGAEHPFTSKEISYYPCDFSKKEQLQSTLTQICDEHPNIDILINNAGVTHMSLAQDTSTKTIETLLAVNLLSAISVTQHLLPKIIRSQGNLVAISSVAGFAPLYGRAIYSASKHGLEGYLESLTSEVAEQGVKTSVICPSYIDTQPNKSMITKDGTQSPGARKKQSQGKSITAELAAEEILKAIAGNKRKLLLGLTAKLAYWTSKFLPPLYRNRMINLAKSEFK